MSCLFKKFKTCFFSSIHLQFIFQSFRTFSKCSLFICKLSISHFKFFDQLLNEINCKSRSTSIECSFRFLATESVFNQKCIFEAGIAHSTRLRFHNSPRRLQRDHRVHIFKLPILNLAKQRALFVMIFFEAVDLTHINGQKVLGNFLL